MLNTTTKTDLRPWPSPFSWLGRLLLVAGAGEGDEGGEAATATADEGGEGDEGDPSDNLFGMDPEEVDESDATTGGVRQPEPEKDKGKTEPKAQETEDEEEEDEELEELEDDEELEELEDDDKDEELEDDDEDEDDFATMLEERWDAKLERMAAAGEHGGPEAARVNLGAVELRKEAKAKFREAMEKAREGDGGDDDATAEAMFEVAMDAVIQSLGEYHANGVTPHINAAHQAAASLDLDRRLESFLETPQGQDMESNADVKKRMGELFDARKRKHGWRRAMQIPYKDYYRMAGGKVRGSKAKAKSKARTSKKKDEALAAARQPRGRRSTAAASGRRSQQPTNAQKESADYIRATSKPFFQVQ